MKQITFSVIFAVAVLSSFAFSLKNSPLRLLQTTGYAIVNNACVSGTINDGKNCNTSAGTQCTFTNNGVSVNAHASCTPGTPPTQGALLKFQ